MVIVHGVCLDMAELHQLRMEPCDPIERGLKFVVIYDHGSSEMISIIPRWLPSRLTCQYEIATSSLVSKAAWRSQKTLALHYIGAVA